ncbi:MAG: hypothetical protein HUK26_02715, partial [Duodenibacillus sp.]|nr:hypothetical protein [Duodenibacillus sp.]
PPLPQAASAAPARSVSARDYERQLRAQGKEMPAPRKPRARPAEPAQRRDARADAMRLEPNAADLQRAREEREARQRRPDLDPVYRSRYGTEIQEVHDGDRRLTEVRVTPGSTHIPYTMQNRSDRPIDVRPGADTRSTLGTPKFIQFGW